MHLDFLFKTEDENLMSASLTGHMHAKWGAEAGQSGS